MMPMLPATLTSSVRVFLVIRLLRDSANAVKKDMERLPLPGETLIGGKFFMNPGGKGANQAVAAARLGGNVTFVAKVGNDTFGQRAIEQYQAEGIETRYVMVDGENPSGVALIMVDAQGENSIAVASGANAQLLPPDIDRAAEAISKAGILLMQLETPMRTVDYAARIAKEKGEASNRGDVLQR